MEEKHTPIENLQEVVKELSEGKLPTTAQAARVMEKLEHQVIPEATHADLSPTGKELLHRTERLVDTSKKVLVQKNPENELQEMLYQMRLALDLLEQPAEATAEGSAQKVKSELQEISVDVKRAIEQLSRIALLFGRSRKFRQVIDDLVRTFEDLLLNLTHSVEESFQEAKSRVSEAAKGAAQVAEESKEAVEEATTSKRHGKGGKEKTKATHLVETAKKKVGEPVAQGLTQLAADLQRKSPELKQKLDPKYMLERLRSRFRDVVRDLMGKPEYQQAIVDLFSVAESMSIHAKSIAMQAADMKEQLDVRGKAGLHQLNHAWKNARALLEHLANGYSLENLLDNSRLTLQHLEHVDFGEFWRKLTSIVKRALKDETYLEMDEYDRDVDELLDRGRKLSDEAHMESLKIVSQELNGYFNALASDRALKELAEEWSDLMEILFLDRHGRPTLKPELFWDSGSLLMLAAEHLHEVPIQRIEHWSEDMDYTLDHIKLGLDNVKPGLFEMIVSAFMDEDRSPVTQYIARITIGKIGTKARNIRFWYNKKTLPKLADTGLADLDLGRDGMKIYFELIPEPSHPASFYRVGKVECDISNLDIKIHESRHEMLYTILWPYLKAKLRTALEEGVVDYVRMFLTRLNNQLVNLREYAKEESAKTKVEIGKDTLLPAWSSHAFDVEE